MGVQADGGDSRFGAAPARSRRPKYVGALLALFGIVATLLIWELMREQQIDEDRERLQRLSERVETEFLRRLREAERGLDVIRSLCLADPEQSTARFNEFVDAARLTGLAPGVRSFALVERVPRAELAAFESGMRRRGQRDFRVDTLSGTDPDLFVIKHVAPLARNVLAWGRDIGAEAMKRDALLRAVRGDEVALTERFTLLQDQRGLPAYLLMRPVYRFGSDPVSPAQREQALLAVAYAAIVMPELLDRIGQVADGHLDVELFAGDEPRDAQRLYAHAERLGAAQASAPLEALRRVDYGGQGFTLRLRSNAAFDAAQAAQTGPMWVLGFGILASLAMGAAAAALLSSQARAAADAQRLSGDVDRLSHVARTTADAVLFLGRRGRVNWVNEGFTRMTGRVAADALGRMSSELLGGDDSPEAQQLAQAVAAGQACSVEQRIVREDGGSVWVRRELLPLQDEHGELQGFVDILHDVTQLKEAEASLASALAESQALWKAVETHAIVSVGDLKGNILEANEAFSLISGYSRAELLGRNHRIVNSGLMSDEFWVTMWQTISSGKPWRGQVCNRAKDGRLYWVDSLIAPVLGADGLPLRYVSIRFDITESMQAAEELRAQRLRLENIIEGTGAGTWELNLRTGGASFSARWARMLGLEPEALDRSSLETWRGLVHPADLAAAEAALMRHINGELAIYEAEMRMRHADGRWVWVQTRGKLLSRDPAGRPVLVAGTHMDITARKLAEQRLDKSRQLLTRAERLARVGGWELDLQSRELVASDGLAELFGLAVEQLRDLQALAGCFAPEQRDSLLWAVELAERTGTGWDLELEFAGGLLGKGWIRSVGSVEFEDGRARRVLGVFADVTARRELEARTQRSVDLLRSVLDNLPCGLSVFDADLRLVADNRLFRELLGFPSQLFAGEYTRFEDIIRFNGARGEYGTGDDVPEIVEQIIARARLPGAHAFERTRPNGMTLEVRGSPMPGGGFVTTYVDVSERKRLEAAREHANELLRAVLESLPCGLTVIDKDMNFVVHNARFDQLYELGESFWADGAMSVERFARALQRRGDYGDISVDAAVAALRERAQIAMQRPDAWERQRGDGEVFLEVRSAPMPSGGFVTTYVDISDKRRADAELRRADALLRGAIDTVNEAFVLYDPADRLVFCNEKYRQLYATSADLIVPGATFEQIIRGGAERGQYAEALGRVDEWVRERLASHRRADTNMVQHLDDGRWVRVVERGMPDGHIVGFRIDITDLMLATQAAQEASQAKSRFLANMSHELRTPMNAILGMLKLLQRTPLDARQRDYAAKIDGAARSLLALLNDILDFSKVEAGKMELDPQPFNLDLLLGDLEAILQATRGDKALTLQIERDPLLPGWLCGDALRLKQVLINLGGNAIKFTTQGAVKVQLQQLSRGEERVRLRVSVHDTGIGIAPEHQQQIFAGFTQAEASTTRRFGGTGLGLSISQRLVQLMGGELTLHSALGQGSCFAFEIELPVAQAAGPMQDPGKLAAPGARRLEGLRLLVVEDNPNNQQVARELLEDEGAQVELADNGLLAVQRLDAMLAGDEPGFDVVLMDVQMPVMDGFTATRELRTRPALARLPVVAMTANVMASDRADCLAAGMNEHVGKPFDIDVLVAILRRVCGMAPASAAEEGASAALPALPPGLAEHAEAAGLDLSGALQRLGGKLELYVRMARSFAAGAAAIATELRVLPVQQGAVALHGFKGVAGTVGARALAELARQGEQLLRQGQELEPAWIDDLERQIDVGCRALLQVADALQPRGDDSPAVATLDAAAARQDLLLLIELLGNSDLGSLDALEELRRRHGAALDRGRFEALDDAMAQLDFEAASRLCQDLLDTLA